MLTRAAAPDGTPGSASVRAERTLVLLALASRAAYCSYAVAAVAVNLAGYQHPERAAAALFLVLPVSAGLSAFIWRRRAIPGPVAVIDVAVATAALLLVADAIRRPDQAGSQNWAIAYAVASAMWLGLGSGWRWRMMLACLLGGVYGASVLNASTSPAMTITAVVNAASPPLYFGIAAAITWVIRRIAAQLAADQRLEQRQQRDVAIVGERERLVGQVHQSVLATLELVASGTTPWTELRGLAGAEVTALRQAFTTESEMPQADDGLVARLAALLADRASEGWRIELIDEELEAETAPAVARGLADALAELFAGPAPEGGGPARVQVIAGAAQTELLARIPLPELAMRDAIARAGARLAGAGGTARPEPALPGEVRVRLRAPA